LRFVRSRDDTLAFVGVAGLALIAGFVAKDLTDDFLFRSNAKELWAMTGFLLGYGVRRERIIASGETPTLRGIDDTHQYYALPFLRGLFPGAVLDAIKLHVDAKRYLCRANDGYWARLSADSKRSLELQGGIFEPAQATAYLAQPGARDAVLLRQWDDLAKQADLRTPSLAHFMTRAARCASTAAA
jgi:hypothetical protein